MRDQISPCECGCTVMLSTQTRKRDGRVYRTRECSRCRMRLRTVEVPITVMSRIDDLDRLLHRLLRDTRKRRAASDRAFVAMEDELLVVANSLARKRRDLRALLAEPPLPPGRPRQR